MTELNHDISFGYIYYSSFTRIFHLKGEIGVYIFFDHQKEEPMIFFEKLNSTDYSLYNLFNFSNCGNEVHKCITLNADGKYVLQSYFNLILRLIYNSIQQYPKLILYFYHKQIQQ